MLEANSGRRLRLDYRCTASNRPRRYEWEQELDGSGFEQHLQRQAFEIRVEPVGEGTEITLTTIHQLKGTARLAGFAMRKGQRELLDRALSSLAGLIVTRSETEES